MRLSKERLLLLILFCVAVLPIVFQRDFTPSNELRYLSIADEALRNHTFFAFTNHGVPYPDKPPLYLWVIMLCRWLTGAHHMWLLSLFSLLPAIGVVLCLDDWAKTEMNKQSRIAAMLMTLTSGLFIVSALTIRMDMLMCLFIVLSLKEFWYLYTHTGHYRRSRVQFPIYIFLAVFTKGALGIIIPLLSTAVFVFIANGNGRSLGHRAKVFFGIWSWRTWGILAVLTLVWFGAVYAEGGLYYINNMLVHQTVGRAVSAFHHRAPIYYYALHIWYCLAPWSILVIGVFIYALRPKVMRSDLQRFFLTVALTTFALLSLISAKLQIYMLPAVPFFIYSAAMFLPRLYKSRSLVSVSLAIPSLILATSVIVLLVVYKQVGIDYLNSITICLAALILSLGGLRALIIICKKGAFRAFDVVRALGYGMLIAVFFAAWDVPKINSGIGYGKLCAQALSLSKEYNIQDFRTWRLHRSTNVDAYLGREVEVMNEDSVPKIENKKAYLLLTKEKDLAYLNGKEQLVVGPYAVVVFPKEKQGE